jgi:F-type H+-transporting ATPase subunit a
MGKFSFLTAIFLLVFGLTYAQHDHSGHDHSGHDHSGHDHSGHDHSGHNHGKKEKKVLKRNSKKLQEQRKANARAGQGHDHAGHDHAGHDHAGHDHGHGAGHANACGIVFEDPTTFNAAKVAFHHISDQNIYSIGPWHFPLPCIVKSNDGWDFFSSGNFKADYHGNSHYAYKGYVLYEGSLRKIIDPTFPKEKVELHHGDVGTMVLPHPSTEKPIDVVHVCYNNKLYKCDNKSTADMGLFGGGITSFYDFSITKNVTAMLLVFAFLTFMLLRVAKAYKTRAGMAPTGMQGFIEPIIVFIQDEVCKPFLGHAWEKFTPFLLCIFFFILGLNLFGQIPFFGNANASGNLAVTAILAVFAFFVTNLNGNGHYWQHIFWMPGLPFIVKLIITPVEIVGNFILKPVTLMLRLFGNITAGHIVVVIFVGLIFIFGKNGTNVGAAWGTTIASALLTLFMMALELLVALIQAFVFTILTASYIGAATEEHHAH